MHEFHAWLGLSDSTEEDDQEYLRTVAAHLRARIDALPEWPSARYRVENLIGQLFLTMDGFTNHWGSEARFMEELLALVQEWLPGAWGIVYEHDDETRQAPGPNAYRVRVMARGVLTERVDPFLSPVNPTIED